MRIIASSFILAAALLTACSSGHGSTDSMAGSDSTSTEAPAAPAVRNDTFPDTLRVATLYGPTSYFIYRDEPMGYDYTLVDSLAHQNGVALKLEVAKTVSQAVAMLDSGKVDLIAYEVPITEHYLHYVLPCGPETTTTQVLVQPKVQGRPEIDDVTDLVGREVYVEKDSKYLRRLENLNNEVGGGIIIHEVDADTLITEDLLRLVSNGEIPMTIVDSDIARLNRTYYPDLDITMDVSLPQRASWAVAPGNEKLAEAVDNWFKRETPRAISRALLKQFYEDSKGGPRVRFDFSKGYISQYDHLFKRYAPNVGWDWRLMAAQAYTESKFKPNARSWVGARGLMQIMPSTARGYNTPVSRLNNPETSVQVATKLINDLDGYLVRYVPNDKERLKFVIAAYNVGIAHVYDGIRLAEKYGLDPQKWDGNVEQAILWKMNPKYYNDPVVRYGYCRGSETVAYVRGITNFYEHARRAIPA